MILRPDALIQGTGCILMAATALFVIVALTYGSELLDVPTPDTVPTAVFPLLLMVPCCIGCGGLMCWTGWGGRFPQLTAGIRCDVPPRPDHRYV
jgi:hypothetical protein